MVDHTPEIDEATTRAALGQEPTRKFDILATPPHLVPGRRCMPPAGWVTLIGKLPRWKGSDAGPARVGLTVELIELINATQREVQRRLIYRTDRRAYGVEDRWEVPGVTTKISVGDCEDFAFFKAANLIRHGVPSSCLRLALCWAPVGTRREAHAVLAIETETVTKIMDNRYPLPLSDDRLENTGIYDVARLPYEWIAWSVPGQWFWWEKIR